MSNFIVYSCPCLNIRIHLATKYTTEALDDLKPQVAVKEPLPGWEFELGMGGVVIEFNTLIHTVSKSGWKTTRCLNCNCGEIYSVTEPSSFGKVIVHENAIYGEQVENVKHDAHYSSIFNIKLIQDTKDLIPMPSAEDVPERLVPTHQQIISLLDQAMEKIRLESKLRIEEFKQKEEKEKQALIAKAKLENNELWSKIIQVADTDEKKEKTHVRFDPTVKDKLNPRPTIRKIGFSLNESDISASLKNKNLDHYSLNMLANKSENKKQDQDSNEEVEDDEDEEREEEEEEEDMFNLDEEFSEEEKDEEQEINTEEEKAEETHTNKNDLLLSSSLKQSIYEIDQKFSWIKKKKSTSKYIRKDFDLKTDIKKDTNEQENPISLYATSVPITIHYSIPEDEEEEEKEIPKKKDILASSFVNYDFSYKDRLLSEQFPDPIVRRKSVASNSLIRPQLDSLVGKSLDTRGLMKKKEKDKANKH